MSGPSPQTRHPVILCIDDAEVALRVRRIVLSSAGYDILTASSGEAGMELFRNHEVDLVLADHFLTGKLGTEIAKEMKATKKDVPILIVSASSEQPSDMQHVDGFVSKGDPPEALLNTIARLLREHARPE